MDFSGDISGQRSYFCWFICSFSAKYVDCNTDYKDQGVDQLMEVNAHLISHQTKKKCKQVIDRIKNFPNDRRILLSAWNVCDILICNLCVYV